MRSLYYIFFLLIIITANLTAQPLNRKLEVKVIDNEIIISVDNKLHEDYGLLYPLTYEITIPKGSSDLKAFRKFFNIMNWSQLPEKTNADFFNGIDAVRFDYENNIAFVSAAFHRITDTLIIKITDYSNEKSVIGFKGISKYYDNRKAAVTVSADDWHMSFSSYFIYSLNNFRKYNLWVTTGIVTDEGWCNETTWQEIQQQLNLGFVEAASHSRNHLYTPYNNAYYEVAGSKEDIIKNLELPSQFKKGDKEYVYVWIAPYGQYDDSIDYYVSINQYLTSRLVNEKYYLFSDWEEDKNKFEPVGVAYEMGEASWGGVHDLDSLNNTFDQVFESGDIYHLMFHPHVLNQYNSWNKGYVISHLEHISNRNDVWYTALGHLYLYHLLQYESSTSISGNTKEFPQNYSLFQNYPNPFNPSTTIEYSIPKDGYVVLKIYDLLGNELVTLKNEYQSKGNYKIIFNSSELASGIYIYQLKADNFYSTRKMILIK